MNPRSAKEKKLVEKLRLHPQLLEQFEAILALAESSEGSADEVESLLIEEVRRLGKTTIESWAIHAEEKTAQQFKADHPDARHGKKNAELVLRLRFGLGPRTGLAHGDQQL